jgi:uncharacterized membrane protein YphA (DoxX/SURF4 family)
VKRWIDRWNAFWFPVSSTTNLAVARIIAVAAQLFWFFPSLQYHLNLLEKNQAFVDPQWLIRAITAVVPRDVLFTRPIFSAIYWITVVAGVLALIGLFTRTSLLVLALGIAFIVSHSYSYGDVHHPEALFAIFLFTLALAPSGDSLSVDALIRRRRSGTRPGEPRRVDTAMWPLKLVWVLLAMTYFSTGITKLLAGGLSWMNGYTLQIYTFGDALATGKPLGIWLAGHHTLCVLAAIFTIVFETFFFVSLLLPRTAPLFFLAGIGFHAALYLTSAQPFFPHMTLLLILLVCLDPQWWRAWLGTREILSSGRHQVQPAA